MSDHEPLTAKDRQILRNLSDPENIRECGLEQDVLDGNLAFRPAMVHDPHFACEILAAECLRIIEEP